MEIDIASFGRAALYLGIPFVVIVFYLLWKWAKDCDKYIRVMVVLESGGTRYEMSPKVGGEIAIKNPHNNTTRMWPINDLATARVPYPGVGFVPKWLQKEIDMAIVVEGDWEPLLNRSRHMTKVASPDIVLFLEGIIKDDETEEKTKAKIADILDGISTAPTREMIASPAVLGNLIQEKISEVVATVAKDVFDPLKDILKRLGKPINPIITYILLGLNVILAVYIVYTLVNIAPGLEQAGQLADDIIKIKQALGVQ